MAVEYGVISIGALSHNRLWGEGAAVRTAHATTTLVRDGGRSILVDPSLPATALAARFGERTGKDLSAVTDVFCTTLRPVHRRGLAALPSAQWWCGEQELETYRGRLQETLDVLSGDSFQARDVASHGRGLADHQAAHRERRETVPRQDDVQTLEADLELLKRFRPAPEQFSPQVQFYPLYGASPGGAGLLLTPATSTVVIAGDAALTAEHVERGQVWEGCADAQAALDSLRDLLELADVIVPGHDNVMLCPRRDWL